MPRQPGRRNRRKTQRNRYSLSKFERAQIRARAWGGKAGEEAFLQGFWEDRLPDAQFRRVAAFVRWKVRHPEQTAWRSIPIIFPGQQTICWRMHHKKGALTNEERQFIDWLDSYYLAERDGSSGGSL